MGRELKASYREAHIFEADPFTDLLMRERTACGEDNFELGNDCRILQVGSRSDKSWHFMAERNVEIVGAATRRYLPGFYLVVGLHRIKRNGTRPNLSYECLNEYLRTVKDMVSASLLKRILARTNGHEDLRRSLCAVPTPHPRSSDRLSPRETEIARLVCVGKQNKEVAYITGLSIHTIENHLKRIFRKLRIQNRAALAYKMGHLNPVDFRSSALSGEGHAAT